MVSTASNCEVRLSRMPMPLRTTISVLSPGKMSQVKGSKAMSTPVPIRSRGGRGPAKGSIR